MTGRVISPHYDPMLAKVIGYAPRAGRGGGDASPTDSARMVLHGPVTNRDSLVAILRSPAFLAGDTTTAFLDEHPEVRAPSVRAEDEQRHALAVTAAVLQQDDHDPRSRSAGATFPAHRRRSPCWRAGRPTSSRCSWGGRGRRSSADLARTPEIPYAGVFALAYEPLDGVDVSVATLADGTTCVTATVEGVSARCRVDRYGDEVFVDDGVHSSAWTVVPRFADHSADASGHGAVTPVPGTITAVQVAAGDAVRAGDVLVVLEAMKMEHRILADVDGVVLRVLVEVGQSVDAHALVVELES